MTNQRNKQKTNQAGSAVERIQDIKVSVNRGTVKQNNKRLKEQKITETGGPKGLEPTRYGDWEAKGRCYDF